MDATCRLLVFRSKLVLLLLSETDNSKNIKTKIWLQAVFCCTTLQQGNPWDLQCTGGLGPSHSRRRDIPKRTSNNTLYLLLDLADKSLVACIRSMYTSNPHTQYRYNATITPAQFHLHLLLRNPHPHPRRPRQKPTSAFLFTVAGVKRKLPLATKC
jgi:hypothetical protein